MTIEIKHIRRLDINQPADVLRFVQDVLDAARDVGTSVQEQEELRIVASELGSNVLKHAGSGSASVEIADDQHGIRIITRNPSDHDDVAGVFADGLSTAGTLGIGLGAVRRLCDEVELALEDGEFIVHATKRHVEEAPSFIETSVLSRPLPGFAENGDGYYIKLYADSAVLAVIDGLGHGPKAAEATQRAISVIAADDRAPLLEIVQRMHARLRHTRGCVIGLTRIAPDGKMEYIGVGNIRAHIFSSGEPRSLLSYSGVVGGNMRTLRVMSYEIPHRATLAIYSDGVSHLSVDRHLLSSPVMEIATKLFTENAKPIDDATLLVARMK